MEENNLLVGSRRRLKAVRANYPRRSKPQATRPNQYWGIDMTTRCQSGLLAGCIWLLSLAGSPKRLLAILLRPTLKPMIG